MINRNVAVSLYDSTANTREALIDFLNTHKEPILPHSTLYSGRGTYLVFSDCSWKTDSSNNKMLVVSIPEFITGSPLKSIYG